jgi:hypothetical protein
VRPYLKKKNPSQKGAGGVAQGVDPEFKPRTKKQNKKTCSESELQKNSPISEE